jgi:REP element-mobilizing transposase RayT
MGRAKRLQFPGACYYIVLQGNNRQDIFMSNQDRRYFLSLLRAYKDRCELKVYAFCLMAHDAHLLIETVRPNLAQAMQGFNTVYTKYFNGVHNTVGHVFQGRYKALVVDKEHFLSEMTRFVHLQPVRSGLREKPWRYQWSSCSAYVESDQREPLVDSDAVLAQFGRARLKQSVRYLQYIKDRMKSASDFVLPVARGMAVGSEGFLSRMEERGAAPAATAKPASSADAKRILAEVALKHGLEPEKLVGPLQWREISAARRAAIHRIWKEAHLGVTELSRLFNRTPSAISQVIRAMEEAAAPSA